MKTIIAVVVLLCIGVACAERAFPQRSLAARAAAVGGNQPYWFLGAPRKSGSSIQAVQVAGADFAEDEDDDDENNYEQQDVIQDDDDDDDSSYDNEDNFENDDDDSELGLAGNVVGIISLDEDNQKNDNGLIELEDKEIDSDDDDDDGETAIILPRAALENIPNGSILALVDDSESTGRAVRRYYYRRRKTGGKRRRGGNKQRRRRRRRRGGNRRRRPAIRVIRPGRTGTRRRSQRRRPNVIRL